VSPTSPRSSNQASSPAPVTDVISSGIWIVDSNSGCRCNVVTSDGLMVIVATRGLTALSAAKRRSGSSTAIGKNQVKSHFQLPPVQ
jgi:hypothetical protein